LPDLQIQTSSRAFPSDTIDSDMSDVYNPLCRKSK